MKSGTIFQHASGTSSSPSSAYSPCDKEIVFNRNPTKSEVDGATKDLFHKFGEINSVSKILSIVQGYKIPFQTQPVQKTVLQQAKLNQEIRDMLQNGTIQIVSVLRVLVDKKDRDKRPVINLKNLNKLYLYQHFKMEGLPLLRAILQEGGYMCKID